MKRILLLTLSVLAVGAAFAADWSSWRGPENTGVSREKGLPDKAVLKKGGANFVFAVPHSGLSTPVILNGMAYVVGRDGDKETQQEVVQAFDALTGALKWEDKVNVWHTAIVDDRLGFTSVAADKETGNVYAHLTSGELKAYTKDGKVLWMRSLTEEFGRVSGYGGRITTPVIDEDKVIVNMPNGSWGEHTVGNTRLVAFDQKDGKVIWWASGGYRIYNTYHSAPTVAVIGGQRLILAGGGDGCIHAWNVRTGQKVWSHPFVDNHEAVNLSPVVQGDKIWIGHGEENKGSTQGRVICIDGASVKDGKVKELWRHDGVIARFATPTLHDGLLYVPDMAGNLHCFDAEKGGAPLWNYSYGKMTKGSPVWADGKIYITEVDSNFRILKADREGCKELSSIKFRGKGGVPTELHGSPAVHDGRIYFTTTNQLVCIGKSDTKDVAVKIPEGPKEQDGMGEAAHIQVVPADVTLRPGEAADFKAYAYDGMGRRLGEVEVEWELAGMRPPVYPIGLVPPKAPPGPTPPPLVGTLTANKGKATNLTAGKLPAQFGRLVAKSGKLTGEARVRVAPVLPYTMDFEKTPIGRTPPAWINTMGKFSVAKAPGGGQALVKRNNTPNPLVNRANAYIGTPDMGDYTVEADVHTTEVRGFMADMGVGACRYTLLLVGKDQELRLNTWDALYGGRVKASTPFKWKAATWYTMKITASPDGKVMGKVWERDGKEPEKWTLELSDPIPNKTGAPLIYGFSNGTTDVAEGPQAFFDNIKITPNGKK